MAIRALCLLDALDCTERLTQSLTASFSSIILIVSVMEILNLPEKYSNTEVSPIF